MSVFTRHISGGLRTALRSQRTCIQNTGHISPKSQPKVVSVSQQSRTFRSSSVVSSNPGPRKLTNILEGGPAPAVQVRRIASEGIELADGLVIPGACIFLDGKVFLWDVGVVGPGGTGVKWEKDMFKLFEVVVPKPEILLLGTGKNVIHPPPSIRTYLNTLGIQLDVMDTWNACTTYNLLAEEGRRVGAALVPPNSLTWKRNP